MSFNSTAWASRQKIKPNDKLVLWGLADHHNDKSNLCYPSTKRLSDFTGLSVRSVIRSLKSLEDIGLIILQKRQGTSNSYTLNTDLIIDKPVPHSHMCQPDTSDRESPTSDTQSQGGVPHSHLGSDTQSPKPISNQEVEPVKEPDNAEACFADQNLTIEYHDKPPFAPDDISTKALEHRFDEFWKSYPIKKSKKEALKSWLKIKPDQNLLDTILKAIEDQTKEMEAKKQSVGFAPAWKHPSTWLNQNCWEDEVIIPVVPNSEKPRVIKPALADW